MAARYRTWLLILCSAAALALFTGCGDDEEGSTPDDGSGADAGGDAGGSDAGGTDAGGTDAGTDSGTDTGGTDTGGGEPPCRRHLEECTVDAQTNDQFVCDTSIGLCVQRCNEAEAEDSQGANCPLGSYCFGLTAGAVEDPVTGTELDGICFPGDCDGSIFDDDACEGVEANIEPGLICTSATCTCQPIANGASFCLQAGTADVGDPCGQDTSNNPPASDVCASGLLCVLGECVEPCDLRGGDTACDGSAGASCVDPDNCSCEQVIDTTPRNQPGVCIGSCNPFSADECPDGQGCVPQWGRFGVNSWVCTDLPAEPIAAGEECDGDSSIFGQCVEGSICVLESEGGPSTCSPLCDPFGEEEGALASCGGDAIGEILIDATAYTEASAYLTVPAGPYDLDIRDEDGALIAPITADVIDGEVHTVVATLNDGALDLLVLDDYLADDTLPAAGLRAVHASWDAGDVDVVLVTTTDEVLGTCAGTEDTCTTDDDCTEVLCEGYEPATETETSLAEGVAYGDVYAGDDEDSGYAELAPGAYTLRLYAAGTEDLALEIATELPEATLATLVITNGAEGLEFFVVVDDFDVEALAEGTGSVRVVHAASAVGPVVVHLPAESGEVCTPISIEGLGFCSVACDAWPRTGGEYPECETGESCFPTTIQEDEYEEPFGFCTSTEAGDDAGAFEACDDPFFFGGGCADFALCLGEGNDGTQNPTCRPRCAPFVEDGGCQEGVCEGFYPIVGLAASACSQNGGTGLAFERCETEGDPCANDGTQCIDLSPAGIGTGPACYPICRAGFDDCAEWADDGRTCDTTQFFTTQVPFMGFCL